MDIWWCNKYICNKSYYLTNLCVLPVHYHHLIYYIAIILIICYYYLDISAGKSLILRVENYLAHGPSTWHQQTRVWSQVGLSSKPIICSPLPPHTLAFEVLITERSDSVSSIITERALNSEQEDLHSRWPGSGHCCVLTNKIIESGGELYSCNIW